MGVPFRNSGKNRALPLINHTPMICKSSFFIPLTFIFFKADLSVSKLFPYRVIWCHWIVSRSSKVNEPKERVQAVLSNGQVYCYRVKSFTRLLCTTHSFKGFLLCKTVI